MCITSGTTRTILSLSLLIENESVPESKENSLLWPARQAIKDKQIINISAPRAQRIFLFLVAWKLEAIYIFAGGGRERGKCTALFFDAATTAERAPKGKQGERHKVYN